MRSKGIEGEGSDGDGAPAARANAPYALSDTTKSAPPARSSLLQDLFSRRVPVTGKASGPIDNPSA